LGSLCASYVGHLEALGKRSAKDAACAFRVHVTGAQPELAKVPAAEIQPEQIADLIRSIREKGKDRMAGVVRSYLNAAYQQAIGARFDTGASASFNGFGVTQNPVAPIKAIRVKAGERTLSLSELRDYLNRLGDGIIDQALMLALLAGGQRMAQLLRARVADWDAEQRVLRLWDGKGKRETAREHLLPLGARGAELVDGLAVRAREKAAQAAQGGEKPDPNPSLWLSVGGAVVVHSTPGKRVVEIAKAMGGESFDLRDIRRTCETQLAGLGISRDIRAQLLSHGLSGVQATHYDRHGYMDEKRSALAAWEDHLSGGGSSNVVPIRKSA
jgi:integrase